MTLDQLMLLWLDKSSLGGGPTSVSVAEAMKMGINISPKTGKQIAAEMKAAQDKEARQKRRADRGRRRAEAGNHV